MQNRNLARDAGNAKDIIDELVVEIENLEYQISSMIADIENLNKTISELENQQNETI
jgi:TolA-binding protein